MHSLKLILESIKNDSRVKEVIRGLHWTAVVSSHCGLASSMIRDTCRGQEYEEANNLAGTITGISALELANYCLSEDVSNASLGIAAINSLIEPDLAKCSDINGISFVHEISKNKNISVIGHFPGLDKLAQSARNFWIIEKHPQPGDFSEESSAELVPQSDIIIISSTALINHTLEGLLRLCGKESFKMLLGPSTPMTGVLFDLGIDILSGSKVIDKKTALKYISEGSNFVRLKKTGSIQFVTMIRDTEKVNRIKNMK